MLHFLEGLQLEPGPGYLRAAPARDDVIQSLFARLPARVEGAPVQAGAILVRWQVGKKAAAEREAAGRDREVAGDDRGAQLDAWLGPDDIRVYSDLAVSPYQAQGARVLGYVTGNLEMLGAARPGGLYHQSGQGYGSAMAVLLSNVTRGQ